MNKDLKVELTVTTWGLLQTLLHTHIAKNKEALKIGASVYCDDHLENCKRSIKDAEAALQELSEAQRVDG